MSFTNLNRKLRSQLGIEFLDSDFQGTMANTRFAAIVAQALRHEFGDDAAASRFVAGCTAANDRAVRNWFVGKNAPDGPHLVTLMRHSGCIFDTVVALAGRDDIGAARHVEVLRQSLLAAARQLEPSSTPH